MELEYVEYPQYLIVNDEGIIENCIVCENDEVAKEFNAVPTYPGANVGDVYNPPIILTDYEITSILTELLA